MYVYFLFAIQFPYLVSSRAHNNLVSYVVPFLFEDIGTKAQRRQLSQGPAVLSGEIGIWVQACLTPLAFYALRLCVSVSKLRTYVAHHSPFLDFIKETPVPGRQVVASTLDFAKWILSMLKSQRDLNIYLGFLFPAFIRRAGSLTVQIYPLQCFVSSFGFLRATYTH